MAAVAAPAANSAPTTPVASAPAPRLMSLDALRGFDMLWIVGGDAVIGALSGLKGGPITHFLAEQMDHVPWEGFHFYDLIFPLFVFMIGVAITLSLDRIVEKEGRAAALRRVFKRGLLLYLLGLFFYGGMAEGLAHLRLVGVLQRLAFCYTVTSLLYLYLKPRSLVAVAAGLLVGYWALMTFVPVPGFGPGDFAERHNLSDWIDRNYLPFFKWSGDHDPEGLLSNLPAVATCLLGVFAGLLMRDARRAPMEKLRWLVLGGIGSLALGWLWGLQFPVIKNLWTSSFVLVAGGWSLLLLATFFYLIDVRGWRGWAQPFVWIGCNPLTIYLAANFISFNNLAARLLGGEVAGALDRLWQGSGKLVLALTAATLCVLFCRFLYQRKIFLRL